MVEVAARTYDVNYYVTSKEEIENSRGLLNSLRLGAHNAETLKEVSLAEKAYEVDRALFNLGIDKFMYRRELDQYVSNPSNGVTLRRLEEYNRIIPNELTTPVSYLRSVGGQTLVLSFNDEVVSANPSTEIRNQLLADSNEKQKTEVQRVVIKERRIDPILFGTVSVGGRVWEKIWILGAWLNVFPTLSTSESIIACLNSMFSKGDSKKFKIDERLLKE